MIKKEVIVDKTTVWKTVANIKKELIMKNKYLDLSKLDNLYIHDISKLFKNLRGKLGVSQRECGRILNIKNVSNYENLNQAIPFQKLLELSNLVNFNIYKHLGNNEYKFSFGTSNEKQINLPIRVSKAIDLSNIIKPSKLKVRNILYLLNGKTNFLKDFKIHLNKDNKKIIHSAILWGYLNTYFEYKKVSLIEFPLVKIYSDLKTQDISDATIIASLLVTEGSKNKKGFDFSNKSKILHDLLVESIYNKYHLLPTTYYRYVGDVHRTFFSTKNALKIREDIEKFLGNIQTKPGSNKIDYLNMKQPSLDHIKIKQDKVAIIRIFSVTEGGVHFRLVPYNRKKKEFIAIPYIHIACSHPKLLLDLYNILASLKFHPTLRKDKTWSRWAGIILPSFRDSINFLKIGGFLEGVNVARTDSTFYGIEKQILLLSILELRKKMLVNKKLRKYSKKRLTNDIFKIIKNKQYHLKNKRIYLDLLKPIHNKRNLKTNRVDELKEDVNFLLNNPQEFIKSRN